MKNISNLWQRFLRPTKILYNDYDLGKVIYKQNNNKGPEVQLVDGSITIYKKELEIVNLQGDSLKASFFPSQGTSTIIYCHGYNACRVESVSYAQNAAKFGISFCCFDFQGSGHSEGEFITLGYRERDDIESIMKYLKINFKQEKFILWGRSLGATTILLHQMKYPQGQVNGIVLDSPFDNFDKVATRMIRKSISIPKFLIAGLLLIVKSQVEKHVHFDMDRMRIPINNLKVHIPALFLTSYEDTVIPIKQVLKIYHGYRGQKEIMKLIGDHNDPRSEEVLNKIIQWSSVQICNIPIQISTYNIPGAQLYRNRQREHKSGMIKKKSLKLLDQNKENSWITKREGFHNSVDVGGSVQSLNEQRMSYDRNLSDNNKVYESVSLYEQQCQLTQQKPLNDVEKSQLFISQWFQNKSLARNSVQINSAKKLKDNIVNQLKCESKRSDAVQFKKINPF